MTYNNATELYDAFVKYHETNTGEDYLDFTGRVGWVNPNTLTGQLNMIQVWMNTKGGKKTPCYTKRSGNALKYSLWNSTDVETHNQFLRDTDHEFYPQKLIERCDTHLVLLNNYEDFDEYADYKIVVDIDSKEELYNAYKNGFDVFNHPHTLSTKKKLPHYYFEAHQLYNTYHGNKDEREIDFLTKYVYEKHGRKMFGCNTNLENKMNEVNANKWFNVPIQGNLYMNMGEERHTALSKANGGVVYTKDKGEKEILDLGGKRVEPLNEVIPYKELCDIVSKLYWRNHTAYPEWFKFASAVCSMVDKHSDPNNYVEIVNNFYRDHPNFEVGEFERQNLKLFCDKLNTDASADFDVGNRTSAEWFYDELYKVDRKTWLEYAFKEHRHLDPISFKKLKLEEAIAVFNKRVAYIDDLNMYVYYNCDTREFKFAKKEELKDKYENLYCIVLVDKKVDGLLVQKEIPKTFIDLWIKSPYKKTYHGGACFRPPPLKAKRSQFNLFTKFDLDNLPMYDEEVNAMSKKELENELSFILQHLRYLSGEDKTDEVFNYQLKYFAHLLKYPAVLPRVSILWISVPRVGKNQFLNFIENIMGAKYYYSSASSREILGDFTDVIRGKLLINLNEFKQGYMVMEALKELITEKKVSTREKHKNPMRIENSARILISSNLKTPLHIEYKDGRFFVVRCNPITTTQEFKDNLYMETLHENITSLKIQKCFLRYCREFVNVSETYNFELNIVKTREYKMLQSRSIPYQVRFFRYWFNNRHRTIHIDKKIKATDELTAQQVFNFFKDFVERENEKLSGVSKNDLINIVETHTIQQTDQSWLSANSSAILHLKKRKQKYYQLDIDRAKAFFEGEGIDYNAEPTFLADSDDDM